MPHCIQIVTLWSSHWFVICLPRVIKVLKYRGLMNVDWLSVAVCPHQYVTIADERLKNIGLKSNSMICHLEALVVSSFETIEQRSLKYFKVSLSMSPEGWVILASSVSIVIVYFPKLSIIQEASTESYLIQWCKSRNRSKIDCLGFYVVTSIFQSRNDNRSKNLEWLSV